MRDAVERDDALRAASRSRAPARRGGTSARRWTLGRAAPSTGRLTGPGTPAAYADAAYLARQDLVVVMTREHAIDVLRSRAGGALAVVLVRELVGDSRGSTWRTRTTATTPSSTPAWTSSDERVGV